MANLKISRRWIPDTKSTKPTFSLSYRDRKQKEKISNTAVSLELLPIPLHT